MRVTISFFVILVAMVNSNYAIDPKCLPQPTVSPLHCMAKMPSYWYDASNNECLYFVYGGCGGQRYPFYTKEECEQTCKTYTMKECKQTCKT